MPTTNFFQKLNGVAVHYDRPPLAQYGSRGVPYKFYCDKAFQKKLDLMFKELFDLAQIPKPEVIISAGAYVQKSGYHGRGRAFDLDGIHWKDRVFITNNYPTDKVFYLGIEAVLRKHFGTVLSYLYNRAHHDHLHIDDGTPVGFNSSAKSNVLFVQAAITHIMKKPLSIDGQYGPQTAGAISEVLKEMEISGIITSKSVWLNFLTKLAELAFKEEIGEEKELSASDMLSKLLDLVDHHLTDHPAKKNIESGIMAFANHTKVKKSWQ